jgi:hypothetical protein
MTDTAGRLARLVLLNHLWDSFAIGEKPRSEGASFSGHFPLQVTLSIGRTDRLKNALLILDQLARIAQKFPQLAFGSGRDN